MIVTNHEKAPQHGPMQWTVGEGTGDPRLSLLPLHGETSKALAAELIRDGFGERCGQCEKPFNAVRKWRGIGRVTHLALGSMLCTTAWLLCGRCTAEMRANGNQVSGKLIAEARAGTDAALALMSPAGGHA